MEPNVFTEPSFKTKLIRGASGGYGWEVSTYGCKTEAEAEDMTARAIRSLNSSIKYAQEHVEYPQKVK